MNNQTLPCNRELILLKLNRNNVILEDATAATLAAASAVPRSFIIVAFPIYPIFPRFISPPSHYDVTALIRRETANGGDHVSYALKHDELAEPRGR